MRYQGNKNHHKERRKKKITKSTFTITIIYSMYSNVILCVLAGKPTAVYYLVLCSVLFAILITVAGMYYILNEKVPWYVKWN